MRGDYHILAFDQRGRAFSDWAKDGDYSTDAFVADLAGVCEALNLDSFILVGHSMGARNSMAFTPRHQDRVSKFVLVDMTPGQPADSERIRRELVNVPEEFDSFEDVYAHVRKENQRPPEEVLRRRLKYQTKELPNGKIGWRYDIAVRERWRNTTSVRPPDDLWPFYRQITCPILIVRGMETDALMPEEAQKMLDANSNAEMVEVSGAHYMVFEENPEGFLDAVRDWLKK